MSYIDCPHCGQRALDLATRCPHCGRAFEGRFWQQPLSGPKRRRMPVGWITVGVLVVIVVASVVQREFRVSVGTAREPASAIAVGDSTPPPPPEPPPQVLRRADSAPATATQRAADTVAEAPPPPVPAPAPAPAPAPLSGPTELRYASTWVNVRAGRSGRAPVVMVLEPGDTVMVDSLRQGWYRAVSDGQTLGYVDRSLVGPTPR